MNKKIYYKVNSEDCIGCGSCVSICREGFKFDSNRKSISLKLNVEYYNKYKNNLQLALNKCPVKVISKI